MWGALLKTGLRSSAKGSVKRIATRKFLGRGSRKDRRQNVKNIMQQQGQYGGGGALAVRPRAPLVPSQVSSLSSDIVPTGGKEGGLNGNLMRIKITTINIDTLLKREIKSKEDQKKRERKFVEQQTRDQIERNLEKKDKKDDKPEKTKAALPKTGFLGMLQKFVFNLIFGWLTLKFIQLGPQLKPILTILAKAVDGLLDWGGKLFAGLATMIHVGYSMVSAVESKVEDLFGDKGVEVFKKFTETFTTLMNVSLIAAMVGARGGMVGKMFGKGRWGNFGKGNVVGRGLRNTRAMWLKISRRFSRSGVGRFLNKPLKTVNRFLFGQATGEIGKKATRSAATNLLRAGTTRVLGRQGTKALLQFSRRFISPVISKIPIIGALLDFALNFFVFKEPLGKAAFKAIGAGIGAWLGGILAGVIGSIIPVAGTAIGAAVGAFLGGIGGDWLGGLMYDVFFGGKDASTAPPPPGTQNTLPQNERAWWDFLGWAGTGNNSDDTSNTEIETRTLGKRGHLRGGFIPRDTTSLLHAGEFVVDADSTTHIRDLLVDVNAAGTKDQVINAIRSYAAYESGGGDMPMEVVIPITPASALSFPQGGGQPVLSGGGGGSSNTSTDILYKGTC